MLKYIDCIDSGTEFCPCSLAERKECIICPQLQDKNFCDCLNWKGTCICQELISNGMKSKRSREYRPFEIIDKNLIREDLLEMEIKVTKTMARELDNTGAYVFLKRAEDIDAYSTPISILNSNTLRDTIIVAVKRSGAKTKALMECGSEILIKGPYWNGIQGQKFLKQLKNKSCLIAARGVAAAPAVMAAKKLIEKGNQVYVLLDYGRSDENFTKKYFKKLGCIIEDIKFANNKDSLSMETMNIIEHLIKKWNFNTVLSAGSDNFHKLILNYIHGIDRYVNFATVNNSTMCCGEGVCGSCEITNNRGEKIRSCKQQYNPSEVFLKEM